RVQRLGHCLSSSASHVLFCWKRRGGEPMTLEAATTGIGSLPHHNIDSALAFSMRHAIPFLPQIPIRNPWEFMIAQALEDLPGLCVERDGEVSLNPEIWASRASQLDARLERAFREGTKNPEAFSEF